MGGWKTWVGSAMLGLFGAGQAVIQAGAPIPEWAPWVLAGLGGFMASVGLGSKIEKAAKGK